MTVSKPSLWRRIVNTWGARRKTNPTIDVTEDGLRYAWRKRIVNMRWADIIRIEAGMKDCLTIDIFYVVVSDAKHSIVVDEFCDGFRLFEHALFERWPQMREPWNSLYKGPAFQPRVETLWQRG
jgi:hypothetical protein